MGNGGNDDDGGSAAFARALEGALAQQGAPESNPKEDEERKLVLVIINGPELGKKLVLDGSGGNSPLTIGRAPSCTFCINADSLSRVHTLLHWDGEARVWRAQDNRSSAGTFINGQRREPHPLAVGDKIQIGSSTIIAVRSFVPGDETSGPPPDPVTGLMQRREFADAVKGAFGHAVLGGEPLSIGLLNVDGFTRFNDRYTHMAGDVALKAFADELRNSMPKSASLSRFGGGSYGVLLPRWGLAHACHVMDAARARASALAIPWQGGTLTLSLSCGVAALAGNATPHPKALVARADQELNEAKRSGGNCTRPVE